MIIMLSSQGDTLDSQPNPRFGRTPYFIKFDLDQGHWEALQNPAVSQSGGAGVAAAQFLADQGADIVVSGRFGPNAHQALKAANIRMLIFEPGLSTINKSIDAFKENQLEEII